jgi:hypothetical protein
MMICGDRRTLTNCARLHIVAVDRTQRTRRLRPFVTICDTDGTPRNGVVSTQAKGHCDQCAPRMSDHHRVPSPDPFQNFYK